MATAETPLCNRLRTAGSEAVVGGFFHDSENHRELRLGTTSGTRGDQCRESRRRRQFHTYIEGNTFVWQLRSSPVPDSGDVTLGVAFMLNNVAVSENGESTMGFYSMLRASSFDMFVGHNYITTGGAQLYEGPESAPTFLTGAFQLTDSTNELPVSGDGVPFCHIGC
jgi:hypothetical protein